MGLSIKYKRIYNFQFTVLQELGRIFLHLVNNNNIDFKDLGKEEFDSLYSNDKEEKDADNFSPAILIESLKWKYFYDLISYTINF